MKLKKKTRGLLLTLSVAGALVINSGDSGFNVSVSKENGVYTVRARDGRGGGLKEAAVYKSGRIFVRAYASKVDSGTAEKGYVTFIFDDGWLDVFEEAFPVFNKYGAAATVGIIKAYEGRPGALSVRQTRKLIDSGWEAAAHSVTDTPLTQLPLGEAEEEMTVSKSYIWEKFWGSESLLYPHGDTDRRVELLAKRNFDSARGYEEGMNRVPVADPFDIKIKSLEKYTTLAEMKFLIETAARERAWLVLVGHHVSDDDLGLYTISPKLLEGMLAHARTVGAQVVTLGRALQELTPGFSLVRDGDLVWEFDDELLQPGTRLWVEAGGRRSADIWLP